MFYPCMNHGLSTVSQTTMGVDLEGTKASPSQASHPHGSSPTLKENSKHIYNGLKAREFGN